MKIYLKLIIKYFVGFFKLRSVEAIQTFPILKTKKLKTLWKSDVKKTKIDIWNYIIIFFEGQNIDFFEFGVYKGDSIRYFSKKLENNNNTFVGFDSFFGLPDTYDHPALSKGTFSRNGNIPNLDDRRVKFIKGFF